MRPIAVRIGALLLAALPLSLVAGDLEKDLGRNEIRVKSAPFRLSSGRTVYQLDLAGRLEQLGYSRVGHTPQKPGEFFWGHRSFRIYRRAYRHGGRNHQAELMTIDVGKKDGMIMSVPDGEPALEPLILAESLTGDRAARIPVDLDKLPEHVWRPVLAAEDSRFFEHAGLDGRSLARALLANVKAGRVEQGGSTITQQLVKNRDLSPKRTMGRKVSEAFRSLSLESEYDKREILQAYLNHVYMGHVDGLAIHGFGTAAHVYFSSDASDLSLAEASLLAAIIQGPNRLSPLRSPEKAEKRRNLVLDRMAELGWASSSEVEVARKSAVTTRPGIPGRSMAGHFLDYLVEDEIGDRLEEGRGIVLETTLDPYLQAAAERTMDNYLRSLRSGLTGALVALDAVTGAIVAYAGPATAMRQPGSAFKPFLLLEAFETCGPRKPLNPATLVADSPLSIDLPSGRWEPVNGDGRFHGNVSVRSALRHSYNVPFVRISRWCDMGKVARRAAVTGFPLPEVPPPSFALGSLEVSPLQMAGAYTVFFTPGRALKPFGISRLEKPEGRRLARNRPVARRVVRPSTAYLVNDLLHDAVENGTGRRAIIEGSRVAGKTGTSSRGRDAWFAGQAGSLVTVVWIGSEQGAGAGLSGGMVASPAWKRFMKVAVPARAPYVVPRPAGIVNARVDPSTGFRLPSGSSEGKPEIFRRGAIPPKKRLWRRNNPNGVVR